MALVAPAWQPMVFHALREYIEAALQHSAQHEWTIGELVQRCADGEFRVLAAVEQGPALGGIVGCMVVGRGAREGVPYLSMICAAGRRMDDWLDQGVQLLFAMARLEGADEIVVLGRKGWLRQCAKYGLKLRAVVAAAPVPQGADRAADLAALEGIGG